MFRSIQSKLIIVYLLLILVAMQLSGLYLIKRLEGDYVRQGQDDLHQRAQLLVGQLSSTTYLKDGKLDAQAAATLVEQWPGVDILVLDANGMVIGATLKPELTALVGKKYAHDDISPALAGQRQENRNVVEEGGEWVATEALAVTSANSVVGVVYLKSSLAAYYDRLRDIRGVFLVATAIALGSTAMLGIALARTITGPVREVTRKAAEMAGGNFDQTIAVRSSDEIGQLGEMFNRMTRRLQQTLTEIQGEKNKVEAILAHMADGLVALDSTGRIIKVNPAAQRMFRASEEEMRGRYPQILWPDFKVEHALAEAQAENRTVTREVHHGSLILLAFVTPLRGGGNNLEGAVLVFHDITEFEKLEGMRREFVANVSHELKTPLTTVKSYVETLLDGAADDTEVRSRFLRVVESETDRMARLVKDLLHLSQLDQGAENWEIQPCEAAAVVDECVARLSVPAERKGLKVVRDYTPDLPPVLVDRDKLQQVILNLLANAIEFTPAQGEITVAVRPERSMVRFAIKDSGIGIPKEDLPRIFERFYRVDKARSRMLGGTGLGLAIARQIVELLGGAISIDSELGKGTKVVFTVPAAGAAVVAEARWP